MKISRDVWWTFAFVTLAAAPCLALVICANADFPIQKSTPLTMEESPATRQQKLIQAEILKLGEHEWAGEYYTGDGLGFNLSIAIAPEAGFAYEWHGCMGRYAQRYGTTTTQGNRLTLSCSDPEENQDLPGFFSSMRVIAWGKRRYLVPENQIIDFCNGVNQGFETDRQFGGHHFLRKGDQHFDVTGFPDVPEEYRSYLLDRPVEAMVTAVRPHQLRPSRADWFFKDTPVSLNAGMNQGLKIGMEFCVIEPEMGFESVKITKVMENESEGIVSQFDDSEHAPVVGWKLSTRMR